MSYRKHVIKCLEVECSANHNTEAKYKLQSYQGVGLLFPSVAYLEHQNDIIGSFSRNCQFSQSEK